MQIGYKADDQKLTVYLKGEIDHHNCGLIRDRIDDMIDKERRSNLVLDFGEVTFMDSSGVGVVLGRYKKMRSLGGKVTVEGAGGYIRKIFVLSGVDRIMDIK